MIPHVVHLAARTGMMRAEIERTPGYDSETLYLFAYTHDRRTIALGADGGWVELDEMQTFGPEIGLVLPPGTKKALRLPEDSEAVAELRARLTRAEAQVDELLARLTNAALS